MARAAFGALARAFCALLLAFSVIAATRDARALDPGKSLSQYVAAEWTQTEDGLPQNLVAAIAQTPDGYLWLATQEGLVRFDGARFVVYSMSNTPGLMGNDVASLLVDRAGALWIGIRGSGVARMKDGRFTSFQAKDGLAHDFVSTLYQDPGDPRGVVWVGTRGGGLSAIDGAKITTYRVADGLPSDVIWATTGDGEGGIWIGTDEGLARFHGGRFTTLGVRDGLARPVVQALYRDPRGVLWIGTKGGGLNRLENGVFSVIGAKDGLRNDTILAIAPDRDGNLWLGTDGGGPYRYTNGKLASFAPTASVGHNVIRAFYEDREGSIWAGMEASGLLRLTDGKVTNFGVEQGLPGDYAWATYEDPSGALWVGTKLGLGYYGSGGFTHVTVAPGKDGKGDALTDPSILALTASHAGGLWIGTDGRGVGLYRDGTFTVWDVKRGLPSDMVRALYEEPDGTLWLGTYANGLTRFRDGKFTTFASESGLPNSVVTAFEPAADGGLWIGTDGGGLVLMKDGHFTRWTVSEGLSNDIVQALYVDGDKNLWIGTYGGGLDLLRNGKITRFSTKEGLVNDVAYQIVDDGTSLWMTCNKGVHRVARRELLEMADGKRTTLNGVGLGTLDGMRSSECNSGSPAGARTRDGRLWFPTMKGVAMVDPSHMHRNELPPPVRIEELEVDRTPRDLTVTPELAADSKNFMFRYTALSLRTPEKVRFKYRLEGFDKDWVEAGGRRIAYYTNLAPGHYRFHVIAANDDGVWNEEGAACALYLVPHFYQTIPFYIACGVLVLVVGTGGASLRVRRLRVHARTLERKVNERTLELARANSELKTTFEALAEKDARLHEDLLQARAFQQRILPRMPTSAQLGFSAIYEPAALVGGDVYDVCEVAPGRFRIFVADTTGHGVQASLRTMVLKTEYDRIKLAHDAPGAALSELNRKIATVYPGLEMRCSACCFDVVPGDAGARVMYANAAHPPLLHVTPGSATEVYARGTFLGIVDDVTFHETTLDLADGDLLLAYTDGIYEQEDAKGTPFGLERLQALLVSAVARGLDAAAAIASIDAAVRAFAGERARDDDILVVSVECLKRRG
jgi:ligand-binding sensor domain-containing protein/serine phosphatase RsbU (regulator of sigma subunit)